MAMVTRILAIFPYFKVNGGIEDEESIERIQELIYE